MKLNPGHVAVASNDELLKNAIKEVFVCSRYNTNRAYYRPKAIVETGTYQGQGTTKIIIDAIRECNFKSFPAFYTIEADEQNYLIAKNKLKGYDWIRCIHGTSLDVDECIEFIQNDEALLNHHEYPDFYIDADDPVPFYLKEIQGSLFSNGSRGQNNVFAHILPEVWDKKPLFVLDSCGGIGYLEFQRVVEMMGRKRYYVFTHDINHIKHFRSYLYSKKCGWDLIAEREKEWALWCCPGITCAQKVVVG
jgi:hypothetical protein